MNCVCAVFALTWNRRRAWWSRRGRTLLLTQERSVKVAGVCWTGLQHEGGGTRMDPALRSYYYCLASLPVSSDVCSLTAIQSHLSSALNVPLRVQSGFGVQGLSIIVGRFHFWDGKEKNALLHAQMGGGLDACYLRFLGQSWSTVTD